MLCYAMFIVFLFVLRSVRYFICWFHLFIAWRSKEKIILEKRNKQIFQIGHAMNGTVRERQ